MAFRWTSMRVALFSLAYFWFPKCCFISLLGIQYKCCHNFFSRRCLWKLWQGNWTIHLRTWNSDLKWTELCQLVTHYSATCLMGVFSKSEFRNNFHMIKVMCISFFFLQVNWNTISTSHRIKQEETMNPRLQLQF